jgi:hypothetical protein
MNNFIGGGMFLIVYLVVVGFGLYLASTLVSAIVRISHAFASASRSLETVAAKYKATPPHG